MSDLINSGNKKDKWTKHVTDLLNWLNAKKQATLVAGENVTLTPQQDGTVKIDAGSGVSSLDDLDDVDVSSVTDGQALVYDETNEKWIAGESGKVDDVLMNGNSIVQDKVASFNNYVELTQAEYDALPDSKYSDGILYCIKDSGIDAHDRFCPIIYSYNEREVGVWTDGKPLYQKTVHIDSLNDLEHAYDYNQYPHGIANIDNIANYEGRFFWKQNENHLAHVNDRVALFQKDNGTHDFTNIFRITNGNFGSSLSVDVGRETIQVACGTDRTALSLDCTIWYTKTTDTAGSGTWGTDGTPMHHYSTSERIVGTWHDGKTLYEKSYSVSTPSAVNTVNQIIPVSGLNVVNIFGMYDNQFPVNFYYEEDNRISTWLNNAKTYVVNRTPTGVLLNLLGTVTIQYTKTT